MRLSQVNYVLSGAATLALLAGCSGSGAGSPAVGTGWSQSIVGARGMSVGGQVTAGYSVLRPELQRSHIAGQPRMGFVSEDVAKKGVAVIAVSDAYNDVIHIYNAADKETALLTGFFSPQGLAIDGSGSLYVADTGNSRILIYAKGLKGTPKSLSDVDQYPSDVAVDGQGNIGVANIIRLNGEAGSVTFFSKAGKPLQTVPGGTFAKVYSDAFDNAGNLFIDGTNSSGTPIVGEIVGGVKGKAITVLSTKNTIGFPGGVAVSTTDKIVIGDQSGAALYTYNAPKNGSLGTPVDTTPLSGASDPVDFAFTSTNKDFYIADAALATAQEFAYPKGGSPIHSITISGGQPIGVAIGPDARP